MGKALRLTGSSLTIALLCVGIATAAGPTAVIRPGNVEMTFGQRFAPTALSRSMPTPIALHLWGRIRSIDGTAPIALTELNFDSDRSSGMDAGGLPICSPPSRDVRDPARFKSCEDSIVGTGTANIDFHFPETSSMPVETELTIYNGGAKAGANAFYAVTYFTAPITTMLVIPIQIERIHEGRFTSRATVTVPRIANGNGTLSSFSARIGRSFLRKGKRVSLLTAKCQGDKIHTRVMAHFVDGTSIQAPLASNCVASD